jgi:hypothetical protein
MRVASVLFILVLCAFHSLQSVAQQPQSAAVASDPQALTLATKSIAALTGGRSVSDVTLSANVTSIVGPDTETGTGTLLAKGTAESRVDLKLPSGTRTGIRNDSAGYPQAASLGSDGALHPSPLHNCWINASWFFPALSVLASAADPSVILSYVGQETRNGASVQHIRSFRYISDKNPYVINLTHTLSTMDIYLDSASLLPLALTFNSHPDSDDGTNIATEIDFSRYQSVNGFQVPFRIQKLIFNSLVLDIAVNGVTLNSGLSDSLFAVQ